MVVTCKNDILAINITFLIIRFRPLYDSRSLFELTFFNVTEMTDRPLSLQLPLHDTDNNIQSQMLTTKMGSLAPVIPLLHPWKARNRSTFFALFALISVSAYLLILAYPALTLALPGRTKLPGDGTNDPIRAYFQRKQKAIANHTTPAAVELDMAQELAAVSSFLASLPQNVIPSSIDPTKPIDPHIVLDFDTRSPRAAEEIQSMVNEVWSRNPVMLYGKVCLFIVCLGGV
jgi:hypothetical protein